MEISMNNMIRTKHFPQQEKEQKDSILLAVGAWTIESGLLANKGAQDRDTFLSVMYVANPTQDFSFSKAGISM